LSGECRGGEAQDEDCRAESAHAMTLLFGKGRMAALRLPLFWWAGELNAD